MLNKRCLRKNNISEIEAYLPKIVYSLFLAFALRGITGRC